MTDPLTPADRAALQRLLPDSALAAVHDQAELAAKNAYSENFDRRERDAARLQVWREGLLAILADALPQLLAQAQRCAELEAAPTGDGLLARARWMRQEIDDWLRNEEPSGIIEILHGNDDTYPGDEAEGFAITRILDGLLAQAQQAERLREIVMFCEREIEAMYQDAEGVLSDKAHAGVSEIRHQLKHRLAALPAPPSEPSR